MADVKGKAQAVKDVLGKGKEAADKIPEAAKAIGKGGKSAVTKAKASVISTIDQDGSGKIDSADLIIMAMKVPGVRIDRAKFLKKELFKYCEEDQIDQAISETPAKAGIDKAVIDKIVDEAIKFERNAVSGISFVLGVPGGAAMAATIPADIAQYYGYLIRAAQKMLYLYGFPEICTEDKDINLDSETINNITICLGVMYGVASANNAIKAMAKALAVGVEKQLMKKALTKGAIYPFVKSVAKWFGKNLTKKVFAGFFKKAIPVVGGVVGAGISFASFKPCCMRLKESLRDTMLSNPDHIETEEEKKIFEDIKNGVIDLELDEIVDVEDDEDIPENAEDGEENETED